MKEFLLDSACSTKQTNKKQDRNVGRNLEKIVNNSNKVLLVPRKQRKKQRKKTQTKI